jgi:hypothetical protein
MEGLTEKDWSVVGDKVPVSLGGPELDRETSGVSGSIARSRLSTDSRESNSQGTLGTLGEHVGHAEIG